MPSYDEVPYPNLSHVQSHPDALATLATLLGLSPAPINACRVLEIGCAQGGNLIPMALSLPGSTFVGIDYSANQIATGQAAIAEVGISNVTLRHLDILEVTPELGEFDYIIAHGIFSWVPDPVRDHLLTICKQNLAPTGIAFVSYNVYPGWHMLATIREMMLYHTRHIQDATERAAQARSVLQFLAESVPTADHVRSHLLNAYSKFLQNEMTRIGPRADSFLLHDELEEINHPLYFHEFMALAEAHGLQYVNEIDFRSALPNYWPPKVVESLLKVASNVVEMEQYLDFLRSRTFRQTLLTHQGVSVNRTIEPDHLLRHGFHIAARALPVSEKPDIYSRTVEKFKGMDGATLSIDHPVSKSAMIYLAKRWPKPVPLDDLVAKAVTQLNSNGRTEPVAATDEDLHVLCSNLLKAFVYSDNLVEVHIDPPEFTTEVSRRPVASAWVRFQAREEGKVTNMRHERVEIDALNQYLLPFLDGSRDMEDLIDVLLAGPVAGGKLVVEQDNQPVTNPAEARQILAAELQSNLEWLARAALLVG
jgi:methyltransferase-like protein/cyclopropane fatty-acyl-phospholipid synthase-like methyltransferase